MYRNQWGRKVTCTWLGLGRQMVTQRRNLSCWISKQDRQQEERWIQGHQWILLHTSKDLSMSNYHTQYLNFTVPNIILCVWCGWHFRKYAIIVHDPAPPFFQFRACTSCKKRAIRNAHVRTYVLAAASTYVLAAAVRYKFAFALPWGTSSVSRTWRLAKIFLTAS